MTDLGEAAIIPVVQRKHKMSILRIIEELNAAHKKLTDSLKSVIDEQKETISLQKDLIEKQNQIIAKQQELIQSLKITQKV